MAKMNGKLALSKRLIVKWANKDVSIEQVNCHYFNLNCIIACNSDHIMKTIKIKGKNINFRRNPR